ncbi:MAG: hypothetical protein SWH68_16170 [Thermodesulfobacteriota bacterium]|nr:hypothetical protein [Thermodesulfobacteriota bacterium]
MKIIKTMTTETKPFFRHKDGRLYFTKQLEQKVLFLCTVALLLWGALLKTGIF